MNVSGRERSFRLCSIPYLLPIDIPYIGMEYFFGSHYIQLHESYFTCPWIICIASIPYKSTKKYA